MIDHLLTLLGKLPTTQARVVVTLAAILATTARYVSSHSTFLEGRMLESWEPSAEWLGFLLLLAGVDTAHFLGKRLTDAGYTAVKAGAPPPPRPAEDRP